MNVSEAVSTNVAVRAFGRDPVSMPDLMRILEAGRQCQSGKNMQPWYFIIVEKRETLDKLAELMKGDVDEMIMKKSSLAVAVIGDPAGEFYIFDCGRAVQNMTLTAWELGIGSCVVSGPEPPDRESYRIKAGRLLNVPSNLRFLELMIFGHSKVKMTVRTKRRKKLENLVFKEEFGKTMRD